MNNHFPLRGTCLGISISPGDAGVPPNEKPEDFINAFTLRLCSTLFISGATAALGHMWKKGGIMDHLAYWARQYNLPDWQVDQATGSRPPQILNLIAWPDLPPAWNEDDLEQMRGILEIRQIPPPNGLPTDQTVDSDFGKYIRARALTAMRQTLPTICNARLCLGGPLSPHKGATWRMSGILEEALYAYRAGQPLFISAAFGGACKALSDVILHRTIRDSVRSSFFTPPEMAARYLEFAAREPLLPQDGASTETGWNALQEFTDISLTTLCARSALSEDEYLGLLTTEDAQRAVALAFTGITRIQSRVTKPQLYATS